MRNFIRKILKESYKDFPMKVGDVGIITSDLDHRDLVGKTCTIIQMDEYDPQDPTYDEYAVMVRIDGWNMGHNGGDYKHRILCGRSCWWVDYRNIRPYVDYEKTNAAFDKLYEQENEEDEFEWVNKVLNFKKVQVVNRGSHYTAHTDVMKILRVPGIEEFIKKFGDDWNFSDDVDRPPFDGDMGKFIRHHMPVLGYPQNGDKCYLVGCYDDSHSSGRNICLLTRISDGKMFLMNERGFRYL